MAAQRPKYALITGCGQGGIGEALALEFLRRNIHPIATVLPTESSEHLSSAGITWFPLDVSSEESVIAMRKSVGELTGGKGLDVLFNNAGICYTMPAIDTDVPSVQRMFDVNLFGPMRMVHHFHDLLIRAEGTVVNMGSIGGIVPYVYGASYNASKAALAHWTNTLRVEMEPFGVKVLLIISGKVSTNILRNDHGRALPEGSYYAPLASEFKDHIHRTPEGATDRHTFATKAVAQALRTSPPTWFWTGSWATFIWALDTFFPRKVFDYMFWRMFGLAKLKEAHQASMRAKKD
ncbi:NAD(P)-binding protein [Aspergillus keveii]|uniref:NAD(P)-binding protein n=1 Tax=Aspergillus keveii TaxID=714993 RepID=A0ABR4FZX4_9EURO